MQPLKTGYAYHGNRMLNHAEADLRDMAYNNCNLVVHMLSHTDWDRHINVMKKIVTTTEDLGMEAWIDNWGIGGPPGDKSHFLALYPDAHVYWSDGRMDPTKACYNHPDFRKFTKEWVDAVEFIGGKTIFWDEPRLGRDDDGTYSCTCKNCRELFHAKYGYDMPNLINDDVEEFRLASIVDYFKEVTGYSAEKGMKNVICVMLGTEHGIGLETLDSVCNIPTVDNIGSDPYWIGCKKDPYGQVYNGTKKNLEISERFNKDHNIWIQTFKNPIGREEDIITATEAAYDAGARTILAWGYYGSISNNYAALNPLVTKAKTEEAFRRIWDRERDRIIREKRAEYGVNL